MITFKEFYHAIKSIYEETTYGDNGLVNGHSDCIASVTLLNMTPDNDDEYEISEVKPDMRIGCGCWQGVDIFIKRVKPAIKEQPAFDIATYEANRIADRMHRINLESAYNLITTIRQDNPNCCTFEFNATEVESIIELIKNKLDNKQ